MANGKLPEHHRVWLEAHPWHGEAWLRAATKMGFDVHHLDGDHDNNDSLNLVLVEHSDHMMIHGGRTMGRLKPNQHRKKHAAQKAERNLEREREIEIAGVMVRGECSREVAIAILARAATAFSKPKRRAIKSIERVKADRRLLSRPSLA